MKENSPNRGRHLTQKHCIHSAGIGGSGGAIGGGGRGGTGILLPIANWLYWSRAIFLLISEV